MLTQNSSKSPTPPSAVSTPADPPQLKLQTVQISARRAGINPNYWYAIAWAKDLKPGEVMPATVWKQKLAVYRTESGELGAVDDACPHKGVEMHRGKVMGEHLACRYHGWEFDSDGECKKIPYLPKVQKLPRCAVLKTYAIQEKYGIIWLFPGDRELGEKTPLFDMPEYGNNDWFMVPVNGHFKAHFSICNENSMDVFHGFLHEDLQGWFDPALTRLKDEGDRIEADYRVSYKGQMAKFLGFTKDANEVTTRTISVQYRYPHYYSSLEGISSLYLMRLPIGEQESRSFALFFLKLSLPQWLINPVRSPLQRFVEKVLFQKFLDQDTEMMESEQQVYLADPDRQYVEINPAIIAVQRMVVRQYQWFLDGKTGPVTK
ncbi:MAG: aromatic ring-hydroxylating dioxygenase subunit alpha [Cyanobacteria bacterium P01_C01_bin.89]